MGTSGTGKCIFLYDQDKDAVPRVRGASAQPVMLSDDPRTPPRNIKPQRLQIHSTKRKLHQVAAWVDEPIILQLQDLARVQQLSMSQTIRGLLQDILRQKFHQQQAATLPELIDQAVAKAQPHHGHPHGLASHPHRL